MSDSLCCPGCGHRWYAHNEYGCAVKEGRNGCDDAYCMCSTVPPDLKVLMREQRRTAALKKLCKTHRRYTIKRPPRTACEACWRLYIEVNP